MSKTPTKQEVQKASARALRELGTIEGSIWWAAKVLALEVERLKAKLCDCPHCGKPLDYDDDPTAK